MTNDLDTIKKQIVAALGHVEAEDGLYFNNLIVVHEDEERPIVIGDEEDVLAALGELIKEGKIRTDDSAETPIFKLAGGAAR